MSTPVQPYEIRADGLVAFSRGVDSASRFAKLRGAHVRVGQAKYGGANAPKRRDASNVNSALIYSWVPSLVVRFRLRRDVDELPRGDDRDV
jgi:hypothetical protein